MITNAAPCNEHTEYMILKLDIMKIIYRTNNLTHKMSLNIEVIVVDTIVYETQLKKVLNFHVVRGKEKSHL